MIDCNFHTVAGDDTDQLDRLDGVSQVCVLTESVDQTMEVLTGTILQRNANHVRTWNFHNIFQDLPVVSQLIRLSRNPRGEHTLSSLHTNPWGVGHVNVSTQDASTNVVMTSTDIHQPHVLTVPRRTGNTLALLQSFDSETEVQSITRTVAVFEHVFR
ncbi:hypothetical protein D3C71_1666960 [compost metagenome]